VIVDGPVPERLLTLAAAATIFCVMLTLGLGIVLREVRWAERNPGLVARALFAVLVAVPVLALLVVRSLDLPRTAQLGIVLMAIAPGAPVALRRSLGAGGHRAFAPALQILVALLAAVSMPLSIAALVAMYAGEASLAPQDVALQVFKAQLLPLGVGMLIRHFAPAMAARAEPTLGKTAGALLILLVLLVVIEVAPSWSLRTGGLCWRSYLLAVASGHLLGGPERATRTAVAVCSAARNPGLALLVATQNAAPPAVVATIFVYLIVSTLTLIPYVIYSRRSAAALAAGSDLRSG
jgi:predicted Na+-dependent transporter